MGVAGTPSSVPVRLPWRKDQGVNRESPAPGSVAGWQAVGNGRRRRLLALRDEPGTASTNARDGMSLALSSTSGEEDAQAVVGEVPKASA